MAVSLPTPCDVAFSQCEGFCTHVDLTIPTADTMDIIYVLIDNEQGNVKKQQQTGKSKGEKSRTHLLFEDHSGSIRASWILFTTTTKS